MKDLADTILKITGSDAEILFTPKNDPGVSRMCADLSLATKKLSFKPKISIEQGIAKTLEEDHRFQKNSE